MSKDILIEALKNLFGELNIFHQNLEEVTGANVYRSDIKAHAEKIGRQWFDEFSNVLPLYNVSKEVVERYDGSFKRLISLSMKTSRKNSYLEILQGIQKDWEELFLLPVMTFSAPILSIAQLPNILVNITEEEREYLKEAIGCAERNFFRASIILGWCAAVDRIHKVVEKLGFDEFNKKSQEMHGIETGRYKRFKKKFDIHNLSELRSSVFDRDLLWVLEYWGLIDSNQNDRLQICFTMRCNAAHPGEANISPENLASFFSDLKSFIFDNPNFSL